MDSCSKQLRNEYNYERTRLISLCEKWQNILDSEGQIQSDDMKGAILAVIGQTKLLLNKKLKQFEGLLLEREKSGGDGRPITDSDLRGFWEMVMIQVDVMVTKFSELEELERTGGLGEEEVVKGEKSTSQKPVRRKKLYTKQNQFYDNLA